MTRYFEVKVTGCDDCPDGVGARCEHDSIIDAQWVGSGTLYKQNKYAITQSCPMWDKTKEDKE